MLAASPCSGEDKEQLILARKEEDICRVWTEVR